ncbi:MAG: D-aminoacyl-tRNA deacylase [Rikenellaceae bacterium]
MRVVIQRVSKATLYVDGVFHNSIDQGMLVLSCFEQSDTKEDLEWVAAKLSKLRIFDDQKGVMNCSINDINGQMMIVSQFTLMASTKKGNRPSYLKAAPPEISKPLFDSFLSLSQSYINNTVASGVFGADMQIELINNGPVTITIDSKNKE